MNWQENCDKTAKNPNGDARVEGVNATDTGISSGADEPLIGWANRPAYLPQLAVGCWQHLQLAEPSIVGEASQ
jgi:hypothetical protein